MNSNVLTIDLSNDLPLANAQFALAAYLPDFATKAIRQETQKIIKLDEIRKQLKKIRTNIAIADSDTQALSCLLAIIVSALIDTDLQVAVAAQKGATAWQTFTIDATLEEIEPLNAKVCQRLIQSASCLGHFHSKPFNTLSAVQFCRDKKYSANGALGFTENQLSDNTANLSISGGSNAFSAFYAILITRINQLSIAEHLVQDTVIAQQIQTFFKRFLAEKDLIALQETITTSLTKTAAAIDTLHVMDKQITLAIPSNNGECGYINITPIINPTVFAATSRSIFYVKNQSVRFSNISLGGTNPSNAGTAVGEVAGQNSRLQLTFPSIKKEAVKQILFSLNKQGCLWWSKAFKKQISDYLLQYAQNTEMPNARKSTLLENVVNKMLASLIEQIEKIRLYLHAIAPENYPLHINKPYADFFMDAANNAIWLETLIASFQRIEKIKTTIDHEAVIREIKQQFNEQIHHKGGL